MKNVAIVTTRWDEVRDEQFQAAEKTETQLKGYFKDFTGLHVTLKNLIVSPDGNKLALEWDWAITRRKDGKRAISHDAIMVDLKDGKIASWREYYDPAASGEAKP